MPTTGTRLAPLTASDALTSWQFAPLVSALLMLLAAAYLSAVWRAGRWHPARSWPARRTLAFLLGLAAIAVATQSSIGIYDSGGGCPFSAATCCC